MKVDNYLVTGADLATMGYRQKPGTTPPLDGSIMSKGEADANYYIDPNVSPWSTYPNTRAPKYQDFPCPCVEGIVIENNLAFGFSQTISYEDCSGNTFYVYVPFPSTIGIIACAPPPGEGGGPPTGCGILRGSVVGVGLNSVEYGGCCYNNFPCTTTSTTTLPQCNYNDLTVVCTPVPATINWSNTQAQDSGYFIDSNLQINYTDTNGNPQTLTAVNDQSGTITVQGGSSVTAQAYCLTSTPPTYWGDVLAADIQIVADGTIVQTPLTVGSDTGTQTASHTFTATAGSTKSVAASSTAFFGYSIGWQFSKQAQSGDFSISVNSVVVVSVTSSSSGNIEVPINASIATSVGAGASSQQNAQAALFIIDNGTTIYNEDTIGSPFAGESYSYTASGDGSIDATASEF
jgi:hypothetical protein